MNRRDLAVAAPVFGNTAILPAGFMACVATTRSGGGRMAAVDIHAHVFHHGLPFLPRQRSRLDLPLPT